MTRDTTQLKSGQEMKTKPLTADEPASITRVHIIPHLRWEREWYETAQTRRGRLLNRLAALHRQMSSSDDVRHPPLQYVMLGGQTVILEDAAQVRPDLIATLAIYNAGSRLGVGPWYINVNESLVSGESLVRNLLAARRDAAKYGVRLMTMAYMPDTARHVSQLPQILRGFAVDTVVMPHGAPAGHLPFRWQSPEGSSLLVVNFEAHYGWPLNTETVEDVIKRVEDQRAVRPDGPFIWLLDMSDNKRVVAAFVEELSSKINLPVNQSRAIQYINALRHELPDNMRPSLNGELRVQSMRPHSYLMPGVLSARLPLKQANARMQSLLLHQVEPLTTIALSHGKVAFPQNLRALLDNAWRTLLKNQSMYALSGAGVDAVHHENMLRFQQVEDNATLIVDEALLALPGKRHQIGNTVTRTNATYIMVWNGHNWPVKQVVEVELDLPRGKYPDTLISPNDDDDIFGWNPNASGTGGTLVFLATVPAFGYACYTLQLGAVPPSDRHTTRVTSGTAISNGADTVFVEGGVLVWRQGDHVISNLLEFYDGGDAGDVFNYSPPRPDKLLRANLTDEIRVETSPLYERLIIRHRMRVAVGLRPDRSRSRGLRLMDIVTTVTLYEGMPGIYFHTTFDNAAKDHRLRAHLRTNVDAETVFADSTFDFIERPASAAGPRFPPKDQANIEGIINTQPAQRVIALADLDKTLNVVVRGLPEYETLAEDRQTTVALTLVRSVGWLSRDDLATRTGSIGPQIELPGAQCQGKVEAEYALTYTHPGDRAASLRAGRVYNAPLKAYQYEQRPDRGQRSYLSVISDMGSGAASDGNGVIVTAFKPPEKGRGWIVRMFNPHERPVEVWLLPHERPQKAYLVSMAEEPDGYIEPDANGRVEIVVNPHEITTIRLLFD